jgi:membrane associated rhomboid family serine protease
MRLHYNSPVVLTFTLIAMLVLAFDPLTNYSMIASVFVVIPNSSFLDPMTWVRIFGHILGHANWEHLLANFAIILLIGPILEEKYGSAKLLLMIMFTAVVTGIIVTLFFREGLLGASGVAFMMILLGSFTNSKAGKIPLTFILIAAIYLGRELFAAFSEDQISQMAHIIGGVVGGLFGFMMRGNNASTGGGGKQINPLSTPVSIVQKPQVKKPTSTDNYGSSLTPEQLRFGMDDE